MQQNGIALNQCNNYNNWCAAGYHCKYASRSPTGYEGSGNTPQECTCSTAPKGKGCTTVANVDGDSFVAFYIDDPVQRVQAIQDEIFQNGPVVVGFSATDTLISQYNCTGKNDKPFDGSGNSLGGHQVTLVGWGTGPSGGYWVVRNSWGPTWNGDGYWNFLWNSGLEDSGFAPATAWTAKYATGLSLAVPRTRKGTAADFVLVILAILLLSIIVILVVKWKRAAQTSRNCIEFFQ